MVDFFIAEVLPWWKLRPRSTTTSSNKVSVLPFPVRCDFDAGLFLLTGHGGEGEVEKSSVCTGSRRWRGFRAAVDVSLPTGRGGEGESSGSTSSCFQSMRSSSCWCCSWWRSSTLRSSPACRGGEEGSRDVATAVHDLHRLLPERCYRAASSSSLCADYMAFVFDAMIFGRKGGPIPTSMAEALLGLLHRRSTPRHL